MKTIFYSMLILFPSVGFSSAGDCEKELGEVRSRFSGYAEPYNAEEANVLEAWSAEAIGVCKEAFSQNGKDVLDLLFKKCAEDKPASRVSSTYCQLDATKYVVTLDFHTAVSK